MHERDLDWINSVSGLAPLTLFGAALMTFGAAFMRGLTGFGMAIILVPLLGMIMRPDQAVVLAILLQLLIGPAGIKTILDDAHRSSAAIISFCAMGTTPLGILLLAHTPPDLARVIIAGIAVGAFLLVIASRKAVRRPGLFATLCVGVGSGILSGFAAMPGPPVIPYYLREAFAPRTARASMILVFFATAIAGTTSAWLIGLATPRLIILSLLFFLPMYLGNALGGRAFGKVSPAIWRSVVAVLLGIAALSACWRAL